MKHYRVLIVLDRSYKAGRDKIAGIFSFAGKAGDWEIECLPTQLPPVELRKRIRELHPDGMIPIASINTDDFDCPVITIDNPFPDETSAAAAVINCDNRSLGKTAAEILIRRGFRHCAYLGTDAMHLDGEHSRLRYQSFARTVRALGGADKVPSLNISYYASPENRNADELQRWLKGLPKPCGLFTFCDFIGLQLLVACRRAGITIPDQLGIIGVDNELEICESSSPTLSSIEPDFFGAGYRAAELLDRFMRRGQPQRQVRLTYGIRSVHERLSTQNVAGPMRLVANIRERIRLGAVEGLTVRSLAREFNLSPRMLEYRFRNCLNTSVRDLIMKTRLDAAQRLLETSNIPIEDLYHRVGFGSSRRLKAAFLRQFGMSMREWRHLHGKLAVT